MAINIPSFKLPSSVPTTQGGFGPGQAITLPKLRGSPYGPAVAHFKAISSIGTMIQGWGVEMKTRQDKMRAAKFFSDATITAAEHEKTLSRDDFDKWGDQVGDFYDEMIPRVMKEARSLSKEAKSSLHQTLYSAKRTAVIEAHRRSTRVEAEVTVEQLNIIRDRLFKQAADSGYGTKTKEALRLYFQQLDDSVDVIGETAVELRKLNANIGIEKEVLQTRVMNDPDELVRQYNEDNFRGQYVKDIEPYIRAAEQTIKRRDNAHNQEYDRATALVEKAVSEFTAGVRLLSPTDTQRYIVNHSALFIEAQEKVVAVAEAARGTPNRAKALEWVGEQLARLQASNDLYKFKGILSTAPLGQLDAIVEEFRLGLVEASQAHAESTPFIPDIEKYKRYYADEGSKGFAALKAYAVARKNQIETEQLVEAVMNGRDKGLNSSEAQNALDKQIFDQAISPEWAEYFGIEPGEITFKQAVLDSMTDPDNDSRWGKGVYVMLDLLKTTGQVPKWFVDQLEADLMDPSEDGDSQRYNSIRTAYQFSLNSPHIKDTFSDNMKWAVTQFKVLRTTRPDVFGAMARNAFHSDKRALDSPVFRDAVALFDHETDLRGRLPGFFERWMKDVSKLEDKGGLLKNIWNFQKTIRRSWEDPLTAGELPTDERTLIERMTNFVIDQSVPFWGGPFPKDASGSLRQLEDRGIDATSIVDGYKQLYEAYVRSGFFTTPDQAAGAAYSDLEQHLEMTSFGNADQYDVTLQVMAVNNDYYQWGSDDKIAAEMAGYFNQAQGTTAGGIVATKEMILRGVIGVEWDPALMRNGKPVYGFKLPNGKFLRNRFGNKILVQPEVDTSQAEKALHDAQKGPAGIINRKFMDGASFLFRNSFWGNSTDPDVNSYPVPIHAP